MEDPSKAKAFDRLHKEEPKWGRHHSGAKELASGYTRGSRTSVCGRVLAYTADGYCTCVGGIHNNISCNNRNSGVGATGRYHGRVVMSQSSRIGHPIILVKFG